MMEPTPALDAVINENVRPRSEMLGLIIRELLGAAATDDQVRRTKFSVVGQCLMYHSSRHVMAILHPEQTFGPGDIEPIAEHIYRFSLGGIEALRRRGGQEGATP
jgi:hypothetical protein